MNYYTADQHWGHQNIIKLCDRPFTSKHEMDRHMIEQWNSTVTDEDTVYHLGDFGYKASVSYLEGIMQELKGKIIFIKGNHDKMTLTADSRCDRFESVHDMLEIDDDGHHIVLFHYPILEWPRYYNGSYHLFGHVHGNIIPSRLHPRQADVGVDVWDRPVTFNQIFDQ
jgi:calcineurin-like phosphoesterase family protein